MKLVKPEEILKAQPNLKYFGGEVFTRFMMYILRFNKLNEVYSKISDKEGVECIDALIDVLEVKFEFDENDLKKIPINGAFITVSNHPFGGIDGILLLKQLLRVRPDVKVLSNFLLKRIEPISDYFLAVNPFETTRKVSQSVAGLKMALTHLNNGGALSIFPAGEVSSFDNYYNVSDIEWQYQVIRLIKNARVPVIPIYFGGSNSRLFHLMGMLHPKLRTIKLPSELLNKKNKVVSVRIGSPIRVADQDEFNDVHKFGRFLRAKTYSLGASKNLEVKKFFNYSLNRQAKPDEIIPPILLASLQSEIENIKGEHTLFSIKNFTVYCAPTKLIPNILNELGRLREITFREVGEGTNSSCDIDEFDLYYNQMFIWDNDENRIVGAYRIGLGNEIIKQYGIRGFYIQSLFKIQPQMTHALEQSLELGRSFVVKDYQRKPLPLFLLWKGILYFLLKNPQYRYLIGPVSISNNYSQVSKDSIIRFIKTNYSNSEITRYIKPRKAYEFKSDDSDINLLLDNVGSDLNKFDKFIGDIDSVNSGIPVLVKKYLSLNAKILAFNVDPNFNNCLDGLLLLDIFDVPKHTIESLSKEVNDGSILKHFYSNRE